MPTLSIIAVFVQVTGLNNNKATWVTFEFADHTKTEAKWLTSAYLLELADTLDYETWAAMQKALQNQGQWILVQ